MSEKEIVSLNLDSDVVEFLDEEAANRSKHVNDLLKRQADTAQPTEQAMLELRLEQLTAEKERAEAELERIERQVDEIRNRMASSEAERESALEEAIDVLEEAPADPENPAVKTQARKVGLTPYELAQELHERRHGSDGGDGEDD